MRAGRWRCVQCSDDFKVHFLFGQYCVSVRMTNNDRYDLTLGKWGEEVFFTTKLQFGIFFILFCKELYFGVFFFSFSWGWEGGGWHVICIQL